MKNVGIIGLGLMGGSFGRMLVKNGENKVFGADNDPSVMVKARLLKAFDEQLSADNLGKTDILIIAVYPKAVDGILEKVLPKLKKGAVVIDFCGIKRPVTKVMKKYSQEYKDISFIGGHPMAGREYSGISRSSVNLFSHASMILVNVNADVQTLSDAKKFFISCGFDRVEFATSEIHDEIIAYTSQLCHVVSNAFIKSPTAEKHFGFSAGSYKDLTRVARLNPDMWADLMTENSDKLSEELSLYIENLTAYKNALEIKDKQKLKELLKEGNDRKIMLDDKNSGDKK